MGFMSSETEKKDSDDEISLIDLFAVLWLRKKMIITITLAAAVGAVLFSIISLVLPVEISPFPNYYAPEALMLIDNDSSSGNGLSSMLGNAGGLASLIGVKAEGASTGDLAVFLIETNTFMDSVVDSYNLIKRYKIKKFPRASSRKVLKKKLKAEYDEESGVLSIRFKDIDPVFARDVVNYCTDLLGQRFDDLGLDKNKIEKDNLEINIANTYQEIMKLEEESRKLEQSVISGLSYGSLPAITTETNRIGIEIDAQKQVYTQLKVQYELLKVTMASEKPVFQIIEMGEVKDQKSGPSRGLFCIIVTFAAGFLSVFLAFAQNAVSNVKKDPQAMAKLRGTYEK